MTSVIANLCLSYCPPSSAHVVINSIISDIPSLISSSIESKLIICGDFNCPGINWDDNIFPLCSTADALLSLVNLGSLNQCVKTPTRVSPSGSCSLLDLVFVSSGINCSAAVESPLGSSDHALIKCTISIPCYSYSCPRIRRLFHRTDWAAANFSITERLTLVNGQPFTSDPNLLMSVLDSVIKDFVPHKTVTSIPGFSPWVDSDCLKAKEAKDTAYNTFVNSPSDTNWTQFKKAHNYCRSCFRAAKTDFMHRSQKKLLDLKFKPRAWWSAMKFASGKIQGNCIPPLKSGNSFVTSSTEKANALKTAFFSATKELHNLQAIAPLPLISSRTPSVEFYTNPPSLPELSDRLKSINKNAAAGPDHLGGIPISYLVSTISPSLEAILSDSWSNSCFPSIWKCANVVPVPKKGSSDDPMSYRPISLISLLAKVTEECMLERLNCFLRTNDILHPSQFGFRKGHSTFAPLLLITHNAANALDSNTCYCLVTFDFKRAFDSVWHRGLLLKMEVMGIPSTIVSWFASYLSNRNYSVVVEGASSDSYSLSGGVPQGSVLGPTLFCIFINDLLFKLSCDTFCFADDLAIATSFKVSDRMLAYHKLQTDINTIINWSNEWLLPLNPSKCNYIIFSSDSSAVNLNLVVDKVHLEKVSSITYLGIIIQNNLSWTAQISKLKSCALKQLGCLYCSRSLLSFDAALTFYKSFVRSSLEYCSPLWAGAPKSILSPADSIQNRAVQCILKCNAATDLQLQTLHVRRIIGGLAYLHKMVYRQTPTLVSSICPPLVAAKVATRAASDCSRLSVPPSRTERHRSSFIPLFSRLWNSLPSDIRRLDSLNLFKKSLCVHFKKKPPPVCLYGSGVSI